MGLYDTFVGEIICPICNKMHTFEEQTKNYECMMETFMLGDYIDKGNRNYVYVFDWYCKKTSQPFKVGIAIRKGQIVKFLINDEIKNSDIENLDNVEKGLGKRLQYEKDCKEASGFPEETLSYDLNPLPEGYKFTAFNVEWEIIRLYRTKKDFILKEDVMYFYEIKSNEHGIRIMESSKRLWKSNIMIITFEQANRYPSLYFDK